MLAIVFFLEKIPIPLATVLGEASVLKVQIGQNGATTESNSSSEPEWGEKGSCDALVVFRLSQCGFRAGISIRISVRSTNETLRWTKPYQTEVPNDRVYLSFSRNKLADRVFDCLFKVERVCVCLFSV